jgi:hypothetical protein
MLHGGRLPSRSFWRLLEQQQQELTGLVLGGGHALQCCYCMPDWMQRMHETKHFATPAGHECGAASLEALQQDDARRHVWQQLGGAGLPLLSLHSGVAHRS